VHGLENQHRFSEGIMRKSENAAAPKASLRTRRGKE
jgi:hypothetical protein